MTGPRGLYSLFRLAVGLSVLFVATAAHAQDWPRTIVHEAGELVLEKKPENIVSTTLSVTGTLLAIGAPVTASAATSPNPITDDKGFFSQWAAVADQRGVEVLYPALRFDLEAVIAADPDLVIVSTSGADSVRDHYDQLVAQGIPTMVVNYSDKTWQELAIQLAEATGLEAEAERAIAYFDAYAADQARNISPPAGGVSIVSFNGASSDTAVAKSTGPHAQLFEALGIDVVEAPSELDTSVQERADFAFVTFENVTAAVRGEAVFLLSGTEQTAQAFRAEPTLANLPAVRDGAVYPLGPTSFRVDYYSGIAIIDTVVEALGD